MHTEWGEGSVGENNGTKRGAKQSANKLKAFELWDEDKNIKCSDMAKRFNVQGGCARNWLVEYKKLRGITENNNFKPGNKNAVGHGAPKGNTNHTVHGILKKYLPDENYAIIEDGISLSPLDILWMNIIVMWSVIVRAQKLMYVRDQKDKTREIISEQLVMTGRDKNGDPKLMPNMQSFQFQQAWDKYGNFINSLSKAINTLNSSIKTYEDMLQRYKDTATEEQHTRLEKLKAETEKVKLEVEKIKAGEGGQEGADDGFIQALNGKVAEVWEDGTTED